MARRVLCFEYATGGGAWDDPSLLAPGNTFLDEGTLMLQALASDLARLAGVEATVMWDERVPAPRWELSDAPLTVRPIESAAAWRRAIRDEVARYDDVLFVAPECDGVLEKLTTQIAAAGVRLACPHAQLVRLASNKQSTAERLAAAGVLVPRGRWLASGERLPTDAPYPSVLKPVDGAGSLGIRILDHPTAMAACPEHAAGWRFESLVRGRAASVLLVRRSDDPREEAAALPASWQRLSDDGRLSYLGGETPIPPAFDERARRLARLAAAALPPWRGLVGVDLVLGEDASGVGDAVIEVNPRVTTSYIGVRQVVRGNVLEPLFDDAIEAAKWQLADPDLRVAWNAH